MKLSRVKGLCAAMGTIVALKCQTGLDINTWIGDGVGLYPVRTVDITAEMAMKIWELDPEKVVARELDQNAGELPGILASLPIVVDMDNQPTYEVCDIGIYKMLYDRETEHSCIIDARHLAPIASKYRTFMKVEGKNLVAVYSEGELDGILACDKWTRNMSEQMEEIARIYHREKDEAEGGAS